MHSSANSPRGPRSSWRAFAQSSESPRRLESTARSEGSSFGGSSRSGSSRSGSSFGPGPRSDATFDPAIDSSVLSTLNTTPSLSTRSQRAEHYDTLVDALLQLADHLAEPTLSRTQSYLDSPQAANERIALLDQDVNAAKTSSQLGEASRRLSAILEVIENPAAKMSCMFLRMRIDDRLDALQAARPTSANPTAPVPNANPFPEFASLMQHPAQKRRVDTYTEAKDWAAQHGNQVLRASYLVPTNEPDKAFVLGVTDIKGSFSKVRNYRDASGNAGKMRVVHMHEQTSAAPKRRVMPTPMHALQNELAALTKARSPMMFDSVYSVVSGANKPVLKLYMPMPDFGIDGFYFCDQDEMHALNKKHAAAAMRALMGWAVEPLRYLHRDEPNSPAQVHRDIKPENMLVGQPGSDPKLPKVNLIDFGLATTANRLHGHTFSGTPMFGAPEYHAHEDRGVNPEVWPLSPKVDVWSLAMATQQMFFTTLTLRLPQQKDDITSIGHAHFGLLQERWQLAQGGQDLRRAQRAELSRTMPRSAKEPNSPGAAAYAANEQAFVDDLDKLQHAVQQADPAMGKWYFERFFRADPEQRFDSEQLASALGALEPLFGSAEADRGAAIAYFDALYPRAQQAMQAELETSTAAAPIGGPDLAQLQALPAVPPKA